MRYRPCALSLLFLATSFLTISAVTASAQKKPTVINPPPTAQDWADIGKLPDWSGVWNPKVTDQDAQVKTNPPPWNEVAAKKIEQMFAEEKAGRPKLIFPGCFPENHPTWMLITHNAMEILFTPGRVTMLGESDGNRLRRIYTDGRGHPDEPEPSFHGHSVGHWEGDTLVVDTIHIIPQAPLAVSEAAGVPNNGDMRVVERIHLADKDILHVDLEIFAPKILTRPWKTTRIFFRQRARKFDIVEGICVLGDYAERIDADGDHVFACGKNHLGKYRPEIGWSYAMKELVNPALALAALCGIAAGISSVAAHHSTTMFDHSKTLTIDGTVVELRWVNPHVSLSVNGTVKGSEEVAVWVMEMTSPGNLVRAGGWSRNAVKAGEKVQVDFSPLRDTSLKGGALKKVTIMATGQVFTANLRAQEMPGLE